VRVNAAAILGHDEATAISPARAFSEMGFDSLAAVELRNRLTTVTGLRLTPTMIFDYPTARALAAHLADTLAPAAAPAAPIARAAASDEPVAIVGMACRYPGGVTSPRELWQLLADGADAISQFPADRGWPGDLYDPEHGRPGKSYTREGGFLYDAADF